MSESRDFHLSDRYQELKAALHLHLIRLLEDQGVALEERPRVKARELVRHEADYYARAQRLPINQGEITELADDVFNEMVGFGPLEPLIADPGVDDIVVNGPRRVYTERRGQLVTERVRFASDAHILRVVQRILAPLGRRLDESTPMVDARLPDGSRVNAIIPPLALDGPCLSIRKFKKHALTVEELVASNTLSDEEADFLREQVQRRANVLVIGGTGSGKTTFLNMMSQWVGAQERVITIEDAAELRLSHEHVVRLETRPPNLEGERAVSARDLVRNALRMRPDRIIVGEVRGDEVLDMLQAMNTGHDGSMTTLHANSPRDAVHRLQLLAGFAGFAGHEETFLHQIASALNLIVHVAREPKGQRRVRSIERVGQVEAGRIVLETIFELDKVADRHRRQEAACCSG